MSVNVFDEVLGFDEAIGMRAGITTRLESVDGESARVEPLLEAEQIRAALPRLVDSAVRGDGAAFTAAAAELLGGAVVLLDRGGDVVAASGRPRDPGRAGTGPSTLRRELPLRCDEGFWGSLQVPDSSGVGVESLSIVQELGSALAKAMTSREERARLESLLVVVGCLAPDHVARVCDKGPLSAQTARRLVFLTGVEPLAAHHAERLARRLARAGRGHPVLDGLHAVASGGGLLGVYPVTVDSLPDHDRAWRDIAVDLAPEVCLRVAVSSPVSSADEAREQHDAIVQLSKVQASGSRYLAIPPVVLLDNVGPFADVLSRVPGQQLAPFVERVLGDLLDDQRFGGQLLETLYAYLQTGGSPSVAGGLLHLHPSTVKYRMRVIRELLGDRLDDQGERFDVELAVRVCLASRQVGGSARAA